MDEFLIIITNIQKIKSPKLRLNKQKLLRNTFERTLRYFIIIHKYTPNQTDVTKLLLNTYTSNNNVNEDTYIIKNFPDETVIHKSLKLKCLEYNNIEYK